VKNEQMRDKKKSGGRSVGKIGWGRGERLKDERGRG